MLFMHAALGLYDKQSSLYEHSPDIKHRKVTTMRLTNNKTNIDKKKEIK